MRPNLRIRIAVAITFGAIAASPNAAAVGPIPTAELNARHEWERERSIPCPRLIRGNPKRKEIALTFDDGPHGPRTEKLLDILKRENVRATFFVVGKMVDRYPQLVRREAAEGHEVANHTYDHLRLPTLPDNRIEMEIREGSRAIERATGSPTRLFRPPGGEYDDDVVEAARRLGSVMVLWTDDPGDYANPGEAAITDRVKKALSNGGIILLHDGIEETLNILPDLIHYLKSKGYKFLTCSEMAADPGAITQGDKRVAAAHSPLPTGQPNHAIIGVNASTKERGEWSSSRARGR